jgi:hypothetical protein
VIGAIILIFVLYGITQPLITSIKRKHPFLSLKVLNGLFWYHTLFWLIYYTYASFNASDSWSYYSRSSNLDFEKWLARYGTSTPFVDFFAFPFTSVLGFSFEMSMLLFAWLGFLGFVCFYIVFKENVRLKHKLFGYDIISILMFLPNMHFWTASLGKGSLIFFGLGLATLGLSRVAARKLTLIAGMAVVYHVRPHVFLFMLVGILVGFFTGRKVPVMYKIMIIVGGAIALVLMYNTILTTVGLDTENTLESFDKLTGTRAASLADAGSGVDISNYPLVLKLFTFWFRPLFFDAPGVLGLFVSAENLVYLLLVVKLFDRAFISYLLKGSALVKTCVVVFLTASIALSAAMSNLGIIIRQKSMVMYFLFFLVISFLEFKKQTLLLKKKKRLERLSKLNSDDTWGDGKGVSLTAVPRQ